VLKIGCKRFEEDEQPQPESDRRIMTVSKLTEELKAQ
jgi:hypothetical protein